MKRALLLAAVLTAPSCGTPPKPPAGAVSESDEKTIGDAIHPILLQLLDGLYADADLSGYVARVGKRLEAVVHRHYPRAFRYEFHIINTSQVSLYPSLGGHVYLTRGLIALCMNEDQLAGALAHAMVHGAARHRAAACAHRLDLAPLAAAIRDGRYLLEDGLPAWASTWRTLDQVATWILNLPFGRDQEEAADSVAIRVLYEASYNPRGLIQFFEAVEKTPAPFRSLHAAAGDRIASAEKAIGLYYAEGARREFSAPRFEKAVERLRSEKEAYDAYDEGARALDRGDLTRAHEALSRAIESKKTEPLFFRTRGLAQLRAQNYRMAETDLTAGLAISKASESLYAARAEARMRLSRFGEALDDLAWAARMVKRPLTFYRLGECYERSNQRERARRSYLTCIALSGFGSDDEPPENAPEAARLAYRRLTQLR
jgi:predicted Zn-dependent protease